MAGLTREELLDVDPIGGNAWMAYTIAMRHAWNYAIEAENAARHPAPPDGFTWADPPPTTPLSAADARAAAEVSQAWSAIAQNMSRWVSGRAI